MAKEGESRWSTPPPELPIGRAASIRTSFSSRKQLCVPRASRSPADEPSVNSDGLPRPAPRKTIDLVLTIHHTQTSMHGGLSLRKPVSLQGSLDLLVLKILARPVRLHGYAIMAAIQNMSGEVLRVEEGSLYPALHHMEEAGCIRAQWITKDTGRRARLYELTAAGRKQLGAEESRWKAVTAAVNRVLRMA